MIWIVGRLCAAVALVVLLAACGSDDDDDNTAGAASTSTAAVTATRAAESPTPGSSQTATSVPPTATTTSEPTATTPPDPTATPSAAAGEPLDYEKLTAWDAPWEGLGAMVLGPDGRLYIDDFVRKLLMVYSADGSAMTTLEYPAWIPEMTTQDNDVAVGPDGRLYVLDKSGSTRVLVLEPDGTLVDEWGGTIGTDETTIFDARAIAVAPDGHIFIASEGIGNGPSARLQKFTSDGEFVAAWTRAGEYLFPTDPIDMVAAGDTLYIAAGNYRNRQAVILTFDFNGNLTGEPIVLAEPDTEPRIYPGSLAVGPEGNLFVADPTTREIIVLSPAGEELTRWALEGEGDQPGYFVRVAVGDDGHVYVADDLRKQIVVFAAPTGHLDAGVSSLSA